MLLADIDGFEKFRAEEGRKRAEEVTKKVASVLRSSFRSVDDICRLRDDEFVVIMTRVTSAMRSQVIDKVEMVNEILQHPEDDLPSLSLSVGIAFSARAFCAFHTVLAGSSTARHEDTAAAAAKAIVVANLI